VNRIFLLILSAFFLLMLPACESSPDILEEELYEKLLLEFSLLNQMDEAFLQENPREELQEKIYDQYGVSEENFRRSHEYYQRNIENQIMRIEELGLLLRQERDSIQQVEREYRTIRIENPDFLQKRIQDRQKEMEEGELEDDEALKYSPGDTIPDN
jgi:hypothetical protein